MLTNAAPRLFEIGDTYEDCVFKIREKYGSSYYIVDKREVLEGGFCGFGKKRKMRVEYTVNLDSYHGNKSYGSGPTNSEDLASEKAKLIEVAKKVSLESQQNQMTNIQKTLENLSKKLDTLSTDSDLPPVIRKIEEMLENNEFTPSYIRKILDRLRSELSLDELENFEFVQNKVVEWIGESIQTEPLLNLENQPVILILVGPTGVGKTTTVAKIAARYRLFDKNLLVRMVTIDRFRIAATEQLAIYGGHMGINTTAAETAEDIQKLIALDNGRLGVMLIDTIGLSPHDYEGIGHTRKILDVPGLQPDVYLTVSASTKASDLRDIMRNYETFGYKSVIVTKFDETTHIGNVLSVLAEKNKPVAFISSGQTVPKNLESASVIRFLMKLTDFKIDRDSLEQKFSPLPEDGAILNKPKGSSL